MKITITSARGYFEIQTESPDDYYRLGRIAAKFKVRAHDYPDGQKTIELDQSKVLEVLAE